ncbi:MAG: hypothetical protein L0H96_19200 [Humibacillus sp.]|nr:hypothetical protein [Humibacillus sp.]MDN5779026.1 hypothetical protein [Humibacillus sp.]
MPPRQVRAIASGTITAGATRSVVGLVTLTLVTTVAGCSSGSPVELNQTRPPVTVTVTTTVTAPATSAPQTATATPTSAPTSMTSGQARSSGAPGSRTASGLPSGPNTPPPVSVTGTAGGATQAKLVAQYQGLIAQIAVVDALPRTGAAAGSALDDLARRYRALRSAPVPAKVDPPSYVGRLFSLELFAAAAAGEARASSPRAAARYDVVRAQTATLLALVNSGIGTALALPVPGTPRPSTPATSTPRLLTPR